MIVMTKVNLKKDLKIEIVHAIANNDYSPIENETR